MKHITYDETLTIENTLDSGCTLGEIGIALNKDPRGISRHVKKYRDTRVEKRYRNICSNQNECMVKHLCLNCANGRCSQCTFRKCNDICQNFSCIPKCKKLDSFPYVCNGCKNVEKCKLPKYIYDHNHVQVEIRKNRIAPRCHSHLNADEISVLDKIISPLIKRGQSPEHILANHPEINLSAQTIYNYIDQGKFSIKNIDLQRKVKYKPRKNKIKRKIEYDYLKGRYYEDFLIYINTNTSLKVRELDTIEGVKGGKAVMSLLCRLMNLQLFFLIDYIDTECIIGVFDEIKDRLGYQIFKENFQVILTDRGKEFTDPLSIEIGETGELLTKIFYCDSRQSQQKGKCEKNHEEFRALAPKGTNFNDYTKEKINLISNHVNNYGRPMYQNNSPYSIAVLYLHEKILGLNNLTKISPEDVIHTKI